jgi:DNA invertase Pin-like site-specific DNA recombinase
MTSRTNNTHVPDLIQVAQYLRMSTEHQQYSPQNQADTIAQYAVVHRMRIVRTYADHGRSGLRLAGRLGLSTLLEDVAAKRNEFTALLVYDVSRWGRFQDADESAYYEFLLKKAGIRIHYCAEQFLNDGSPLSVLFKTLKRTMAAEYSRELSSKVFAGQCRLIELGYRQGGLAGFGLRRQLLDKDGNRKTRLATKEYKSLQTDRVILVPGPQSEIAVVRRIYRSFIHMGKRETQIASELNAKGLKSPYGKPWAAFNVHEVLINPKYAGINVYNRSSFKLKHKRVRNPPEMWVQKDHAFEGIVSTEDFLAVQTILDARNHHWTDDEMLDRLRDLLKVTGTLSNRIIDKAKYIPRSQCYARRFGGLNRAYALIGWSPERDNNWVEAHRIVRAHRSLLIDSIKQELTKCGASLTVSNRSSQITINNAFTVLIRVARCYQKAYGLSWRIRVDHSRNHDVVLVARLNLGDDSIMDYYVLPAQEIPVRRLRVRQSNADLDVYRFDNLDLFFSLCNTRLINRDGVVASQ